MRSGGFSLLETLVSVGVAAIVTLVAASVITRVGTGVNFVSSQGSNVQLATELRTIVARRDTCAPAMVGRPTAYAGQRAVGIRLGAGGAVVQAGAVLPNQALEVASLDVKNFAAAGAVNGTDQLYLGDLVLTTRSRDASVTAFRSVAVARLAFEVRGGALVACYASDSARDTSATLQNVCNRITSPQGQPSQWANGRCVANDVDIATTCGQMGGSWTGSSCVIKRTSFVVSRYVPAGAYNNGTGYGVSCPSDSVMTGGACTSVIPPRIPVGGMYLGGGYANYFGCAWQLGYEDTAYNVYAACLR